MKSRWDVLKDIVPLESGCWMFMREAHALGYPQTKIEGQHLFVHRVVYGLLIGPIPYGLCLDHLCRHRWCVNPTHLEAVTLAENSRRGNGMGGRNWRKQTCPAGHEYDYVGPDNARRCTICDSQAGERRWRTRRDPSKPLRARLRKWSVAR